MKTKSKFNNLLCDGNNKIIIGVDEVGRGPLAGPVVVCAFAVCQSSATNFFRQAGTRFASSGKSTWAYKKFIALLSDKSKIKDSKKLSEKQREEIFSQIKNSSDFVWAIGQVSESMIDKINILQATKLAMQKAMKKLLAKVGLESDSSRFCVLIDGNMKFDENYFGKNVEYKSIVKGDEKIFEISIASIIAKVYRDNLMKKYAKKYPQYGFEIHKGYGTKKHYENINENGLCKIHRETFFNKKHGRQSWALRLP